MTDFFDVITTNTLKEVIMIAGDEQLFSYYIYNDLGLALSLQFATVYVNIFRYGNPSGEYVTVSGSKVISGSMSNQFNITFSGSGISPGLYQQQVVIVDSHGHTHIPAQGKIVILPSPQSA